MQEKNGAPQPLETAFGPLEIRVLESLWSRSMPACVRDIQPDFPGVAYTTLMTTLDRLYRKGTLSRLKMGRAFYYQTKSSQQGLISEVAGTAFASLLPGGDAASLRPILSLFVETVGERDQRLLDELESLVRARRDALRAQKAQ